MQAELEAIYSPPRRSTPLHPSFSPAASTSSAGRIFQERLQDRAHLLSPPLGALASPSIASAASSTFEFEFPDSPAMLQSSSTFSDYLGAVAERSASPEPAADMSEEKAESDYDASSIASVRTAIVQKVPVPQLRLDDLPPSPVEKLDSSVLAMPETFSSDQSISGISLATDYVDAPESSSERTTPQEETTKFSLLPLPPLPDAPPMTLQEVKKKSNREHFIPTDEPSREDPEQTEAANEASLARMKSILGPKMKIISPAPWDDEVTTPLAFPSASTAPRKRVPPPVAPINLNANLPSDYTVASSSPVSEKAPSVKGKENQKPRSRMRSLSFGSRKAPNFADLDAEMRERDEALKGLGLSTSGSGGGSPTKARSIKNFLRSEPSTPSAGVFDAEDGRGRTMSSDSQRVASSSAAPTMSRGLRLAKSSGKLRESAAGKPKPPPLTIETTTFSQVDHIGPLSAPATISSFDFPAPPSDPLPSPPVPTLSNKASRLSMRVPPPTIPLPDLPALVYEQAPPLPVTPTTPASVYSMAETSIRTPVTPTGTPAPKTSTPTSAKFSSFEQVATPSSKPHDISYIPMNMPADDETLMSRNKPTTPRSIKSKKGFLKRIMSSGSLSGAAASYQAPTQHEPMPQVWHPSQLLPSQLKSTPSSQNLAPAVSVTISEPSNPMVTPSQMTRSLPANGGKVSFLNPPTPDPEQRLRRTTGGLSPNDPLAPALSLRPVSMAFSQNFSVEMMAEHEEGLRMMEEEHQAALNASANSSSEVEGLRSPYASSFRSGAASSIFDDSASISTVGTPLTPSFSPVVGGRYFDSAVYGEDTPENMAALQEKFTRAKKLWRSREVELEGQIMSLKAELERAISDSGLDNETKCEKCNRGMPTVNSILSRPRVKNQGGSSMFSGVKDQFLHNI